MSIWLLKKRFIPHAKQGLCLLAFFVLLFGGLEPAHAQGYQYLPPESENPDFAKSAYERRHQYLREKNVRVYRRKPVNYPAPLSAASTPEMRKPLNQAAQAVADENLETIAPAAGPAPLMDEPPVPPPQTRVLIDVPATPPMVTGFSFRQRPASSYAQPPVATQIETPQVVVSSSPEIEPPVTASEEPMRPLPPLPEAQAIPVEPASEEVPMPPPPPTEMVSEVPAASVEAASAVPASTETPAPEPVRIATVDQHIVTPKTETYETDNGSMTVSTMTAADLAKKLSADAANTPPPDTAAAIPPVEPVVPPENAQAAQAESLSPETERILAALPQYSEERPVHSASLEQIDIDRDNPGISLKNKEVMKEEEAVGLDTNTRKPQYDVGYDLEKAYEALVAGDTQEAVRIYESALDADPDNTMALFGLATTYHRLGLLDQARPLYGKLLRLDPFNREALNNFLALVGEEAPNAAVVQLEKLEESNPDFSPIPAQLSVLYQRLGEKDKAIEKMVKAATLSPENLVYKYNLAILYDQNGDAAPAIALYKQLLMANEHGQALPSSVDSIQERLTFLASNYKG